MSGLIAKTVIKAEVMVILYEDGVHIVPGEMLTDGEYFKTLPEQPGEFVQLSAAEVAALFDGVQWDQTELARLVSSQIAISGLGSLGHG